MSGKLDRCVGKIPSFVDCKWYGFYDTPISKDTRCEYCYNILKNTGRPMYRLVTHSGNINCDSISDAALSMMDYNGMKFQVLNGSKTAPFLAYGPKSANRADGVFTVEMPESTEYSIKLDLPTNYYIYKAKVGDREVVVNNGQEIFYSGATTINGFEIGKNNNFKFIANKSGVGGPTDNKDPNSDLITIAVKTFRRERKNVYRALETSRGCDSDDCWGGPKPLKKGRRGLDVFGPSKKCAADDGDSDMGSGMDMELFAATSATTYKGRTEVGSGFVPTVNTNQTEDKFHPLKEFTVVIQLIHVDRGFDKVPVATVTPVLSDKQKALLMNDLKDDLNTVNTKTPSTDLSKSQNLYKNVTNPDITLKIPTDVFFDRTPGLAVPIYQFPGSSADHVPYRPAEFGRSIDVCIPTAAIPHGSQIIDVTGILSTINPVPTPNTSEDPRDDDYEKL
jgi:hypothetical protein